MVLYLLPLLNPWVIIKMWTSKEFSLGITLVDVHPNYLNWFDFIFVMGGLLIILIDCMNVLSPFLDVTRMSMSIVSFFAQLDYGILCVWNAFL